jgi:predicted transcriptional regulator
MRVLHALGHREPMSMREFTEASRRAPQHARALREDLARLGLIDVRESAGYGNTTVMEIRLTARGKQIADALARIERAMTDHG